jgi:hypothetical protein
MRGNAMLPMFQRCATITALVVGMIFLLATASAAQAPKKQDRESDSLEKMARQEFGDLSAAERTLVRGASHREVQWVGPNPNPEDPANDPAKTEKWGPERSIRAGVLAWLISDPDPAEYIHPSGAGIAGARIVGNLDLSYQEVARPLTLIRCSIPDGIDFSNASLAGLEVRSSVTGPMTGDFSKVSGNLAVLFGHNGILSVYRATIDGDLDCTGSNFTGSGADDPISAQQSTISGDAIFHQDFTTDGTLYFRLAKIGHALSINHAHFIGAGENGLDAQRAFIHGPLYWIAVEHTPHTKLDLENATIGSLFDDPASWPAAGNLDVDGLTYGEFGAGSPADSPSRLKWLELQQPGYRPQPFMQLAKVLKESGRIDGETDTLIAQRIAQRQSGHLPFTSRMWNVLLEDTIGYGYLPMRALWWIAAFVLYGTLLFHWAYGKGVMTPTESDAFESFSKTGKPPEHYPHFNSFVYSLENFLPVVDLHLGSHWRPNARHQVMKDPATGEWSSEQATFAGSLVRWYLWFHIVAGWVLTPLLFAGLSGLIRVE